jgi:hypothetical protein
LIDYWSNITGDQWGAMTGDQWGTFTGSPPPSTTTYHVSAQDMATAGAVAADVACEAFQ